MNAFPSPRDPKTGSDDKGMTLRDYIAIKAMQSLIRENEGRFPMDEIVRASWQFADEMLIARDLWHQHQNCALLSVIVIQKMESFFYIHIKKLSFSNGGNTHPQDK